MAWHRKAARLVAWSLFLTILLANLKRAHATLTDRASVVECAENGGYFDSSSLTCETCDDATTAAISSDETIGCCLCRSGSVTSTMPFEAGLHVDVSCDGCAPGQVPSHDQTFCLDCNGINGTQLVDGRCECTDSQAAAVDRSPDGQPLAAYQCLQCQQGFYPNEGACVACPDPTMVTTVDGSCACSLGFTRVLDTCVPSTVTAQHPPRDSDEIVTFQDVAVTTRSQVNADLLYDNFILCISQPRNRTACQVLANLCALRLFESLSPACQRYATALSEADLGQNGFASWPRELPWLLVSDADDLDSQSVGQKYSTDTSAGVDETVLDIVVASFGLRGDFHGLVALTDQLEACGASRAQTQAWRKFGTSGGWSCTVPINQLAEADDELRFFEPFLRDPSSTPPRLLPLPLHIIIGGRTIDSSVRRLFRTDAVSSIAPGEDSPLVVRHLQQLSIDVRLKGGGKIQVPAVTAHYQDISVDNEDESIKSQFKIQYQNEDLSVYQGAVAAVAVAAAISALLAVPATAGWQQRNGRQDLDAGALFFWIWSFCRSFSALTFTATAAIGLYLLVAFRSQSVAEVVLSKDTERDALLLLLMTGLWSGFIAVVGTVLRQIRVDVFFIDWERPRQAPSSPHQSGLSLWRTSLVANEWNELQTFRRVNLPVSLLLLLALLHGAGLEDAAETQPDTDSDHDAEDSCWLRAALLVLLLAAIEVAQVLYMAIVHERYIEDKLGQFVDLCALANVSVLMLDDLLHGYYIHGRSPHGQADVSLWQIRKNLRLEADDATAHRGLEPGTDLQTFEIFIQQLVRRQWNAVMDALQNTMPTASGANPSTSTDEQDSHAEAAHTSLNRFFVSFLQHTFRGLDYVVKQQPTLARLLGLGASTASASIFYRDRGNSFASVLFFGNEATLFVFEATLLASFDLLCESYTGAAALTLVVMAAIGMYRESAGKSNLARKTLIDENFLI